MQNCNYSILFTYYSPFGSEKKTITIYCIWQGCLSASETGDVIGFKQSDEHNVVWSTGAKDAWWIIVCTFERRIAVSCEISRADRCLFCLSSWLSTRSSTATRRTRSTAVWLPDNCTRLVAVWLLFSRLSMPSSFQLQSGNSCNGLRGPYHFDRERFLIRIPSSCEIFMILFNFY